MDSFGAFIATRVLLGFSEAGTLVGLNFQTVLGQVLIQYKLVGLGVPSR